MANIYVDPINGNNANAGDSMASGHAKKTITRGAGNAWSITCDGDTIELKAETYDSSNQGYVDDYYELFSTTNGDSVDIDATVRKWPDASNVGNVILAHDDVGYCLRPTMHGAVAFENITFTSADNAVSFANYDTYNASLSFDSDCVLNLDSLAAAANGFLFNGIGTPKLYLNGCWYRWYADRCGWSRFSLWAVVIAVIKE